MRACNGQHPGREARLGPYTQDQCRLCWLDLNDPAYHALWAGATPVVPPAGQPCRHRGATLREEVCPACRGHVRLKVFACALHSECTVAKAIAGLACCANCPDYAPVPELEAGA